jgi:ketosteroid isomerase-like protein
MLTRRETLSGVGGATLASGARANATAADHSAQAALLSFLRAFEDCDLARMEVAFARDATCFDRAPREPGNLASYRRAAGMPAGMRQLASTLPARVPGPPYQRLIPRNLACETYGEIALCTFELDGADGLGRRTIVLRRQAEGWKITHIHASNVYPKAE